MPTDEDRGLQPVIGIVLLLAISVMLAGVLGTMALGFEGPSEPAPTVSSTSGFEVSPDGGSGDGTIEVRHQAGDPVDLDDVRVVVTREDGSTATIAPAGAGGDGVWTAGEALEVPATADDLCGGGEAVEMRLVHEGAESSTTLATETVPLEASEFAITDGTVSVDHEYEAEVTVVYTGFTYGAGGPRIPIEVRVDADSAGHSWANVNSGSPDQEFTREFSDQNAGDAISVEAEASSYWGFGGNTRRSTDDTEYVEVYRDGDEAPDYSGMGDQDAVADTLEEYVQDGEITLEDNQAIYLFELSDAGTGSSAFDLQDTVVLTTLWSTEDEPQVVESGGEPEIVCGP